MKTWFRSLSVYGNSFTFVWKKRVVPYTDRQSINPCREACSAPGVVAPLLNLGTSTSAWIRPWEVPLVLGPRCQSRLLFFASCSDNGGKMFSTCGVRGVGSIAEALISVGIVRINGSHCRLRCLFPKFSVARVVKSFVLRYISGAILLYLLFIGCICLYGMVCVLFPQTEWVLVLVYFTLILWSFILKWIDYF